MGRSGANFNKGTVGANVNTKADSISALLASGPAIVGLVALGVTVTVNTLAEAEALGFTANYDATASARVYRHISEFYRMAGDGTELNIMLYPQASAPADIFNATYGQKLITDCAGRIKQLAVAYNPASGYTATYVDGMESTVRAAIPAAQVFADWASTAFRPLHVVLEGRGINVSASTALNLRGIQVSSVVVEYNQVSLMIGQDYDYAETQDAIGKKMADVGTLLGTISACAVNENVGEVGRRNVTNTAKLKWLRAGISSHTLVSTIDADLAQWDTKGYILCWDYNDEAIPGVRFNSDHVCAPIVEDDDNNLNESSIALSRTNNKVRRALRSAYLPKVNSTEALDKSTGKLPLGIVKSLEKVGDDVFARMEAAGEISGGKTVVDPDSNLLTGSRTLNVSFNWQPEGTIGQINGVVNIKSQLS